MPRWPVTVALTDEEAGALDALAEAEYDGDRDEAIEALLESWLRDRDRDRGRGATRFRR